MAIIFLFLFYYVRGAPKMKKIRLIFDIKPKKTFVREGKKEYFCPISELAHPPRLKLDYKTPYRVF